MLMLWRILPGDQVFLFSRQQRYPRLKYLVIDGIEEEMMTAKRNVRAAGQGEKEEVRYFF
jgi:hypothetical protein